MKPVLLILDMQQKYYSQLPHIQSQMDRASEYINYLSQIFRTNDIPVINIYHKDNKTGFMQGSERFEYIPAIKIKKVIIVF